MEGRLMDYLSEVHSTVPYSYFATLVRSVWVPAKDSDQRPTMVSEEAMHVRGRVHPEPYDHATAVADAQERLAHLMAGDWVIESLVVNGYSTKTAGT